eukprot:4673503-Pyramimonas_sp.AAC.1
MPSVGTNHRRREGICPAWGPIALTGRRTGGAGKATSPSGKRGSGRNWRGSRSGFSLNFPPFFSTISGRSGCG